MEFNRKVSESDILTFADLSGDHARNHVDEEYMKHTMYGKRIAHGALLVGFMSKASTLILERYPHSNQKLTAVSLGYDRIRFIKPVFIDDTLNIKYTVVEYDKNKLRSNSNIEIHNQKNELVAVAVHILKWLSEN